MKCPVYDGQHVQLLFIADAQVIQQCCPVHGLSDCFYLMIIAAMVIAATAGQAFLRTTCNTST